MSFINRIKNISFSEDAAEIIQKLTMQLAEKDADLQKLKTEYSQLSKTVSAHQKNELDYQHKCALLKEELHITQQSLMDKDKELEVLRKDGLEKEQRLVANHNNKMRQYEEKITLLERSERDLKKQVAGQEAKIDGLLQQKERMDGLVTEQGESLEAAIAENAELKQAVSRHQDRIEQLEKDQTDKDAQLQEYKASLELATSKMAYSKNESLKDEPENKSIPSSMTDIDGEEFLDSVKILQPKPEEQSLIQDDGLCVELPETADRTVDDKGSDESVTELGTSLTEQAVLTDAETANDDSLNADTIPNVGNEIETPEGFEEEFFEEVTDPDALVAAEKLFIPSVYDTKEDRFYDAKDFFRKPENELILWRRTLQEAISIDKPRLICPQCRQMVKLCGRKTSRGKVCYFAHFKDSEACSYKTSTGQSKAEIEYHKYGAIQESGRHKALKALIAESLRTEKSQAMGVTQVECEKRIKSTVPYLDFRRPDVYAEYNGMRLVFELQLSTTFVSVVVDRDIFYRLNGYQIIWVFNFDDNQEYVNLTNLMCKDIYYANKRNVFFFDADAQEQSARQGELVLKCRWLDEDNRWSDPVFVTLADLQVDAENAKLYYFDADKSYMEKYPEMRSRRASIEHNRQELMSALMERMERDQSLAEQEKDRIAGLTEQLRKDGTCAECYCDKNRYGFRYGDEVLITPKYSSVEKRDDGHFLTVFNRKNGLVWSNGVEGVPPEYKRIDVIDSDFHVAIASHKCIDLYIGSLKVTLDESFNEKEQTIQLEQTNDGYLVKLCTNTYEFDIQRKFSSNNHRRVKQETPDEEILLVVTVAGESMAVQSFMDAWLVTRGAASVTEHLSQLSPSGMDGLWIANQTWDGLYGLVDAGGRVVLDFKYHGLWGACDGYLIFSVPDGEYIWKGIMDRFGGVYAQPFVEDLFYLGEGLFAWRNRQTRWGICDVYGNKLTEGVYTCIKYQGDGKIGASCNESLAEKFRFERKRPVYDEIQGLMEICRTGECIYTESPVGEWVLRSSGEVCGLYTQDGTELLPMEYLSIDWYRDTCFVVRNSEGEWYLWDNGQLSARSLQIQRETEDRLLFMLPQGCWRLGTLHGPFAMDYYHSIRRIHENLLVGIKKTVSYNGEDKVSQESFTMLDNQGQAIGDLVYTDMGEFHDGKATAWIGQTEGEIDRDGRPVFKPVRREADGVILMGAFQRYYYCDTQGHPLTETFVSARKFNETYWLIRPTMKSICEKLLRRSDWKVLDEPVRDATLLREGVFVADLLNGERLVIRDMQVILRGRFLSAFVTENLVCVQRYGYPHPKWGVFDNQGNLLEDYVFDELQLQADGTLAVRTGETTGVLSATGERQRTEQEIHDDRVLQSGFGPTRLVDGTGQVILSSEGLCRSMEPLGDRFLKLTHTNGKQAVYDLDGKEICGFVLEKVSWDKGTRLFLITKGGYAGRMDEQGVLMDDETVPVMDGAYVIFKQLGKKGVRTATGRLVTRRRYQEIKPLEGNFPAFAVSDGKGWGLVSVEGKLLCKCEYQRLTGSKQGYKAVKAGKTVELDTEGKER